MFGFIFFLYPIIFFYLNPQTAQQLHAAVWVETWPAKESPEESGPITMMKPYEPLGLPFQKE